MTSRISNEGRLKIQFHNQLLPVRSNDFVFPQTIGPSHNWYENIPQELSLNILEPEGKRKLEDYYRDAGLLRWWRRRYFFEVYSRQFDEAARFLMPTSTKKFTILDLGCGTGTQSLFFGLCGARVIGVDMDQNALDVLMQRRAFYAKQAGRMIDFTHYRTNAFEFDYSQIGPINGLYSMFAFNMMRPSELLLDRVTPFLADNARIAIIDGNWSCWRAKFSTGVPDRPWTPREFENALERKGFRVVHHQGVVALPPMFWNFLPLKMARRLNRAFCRNWVLPVSHQILAERV